ncbi:MAG: helix-turn-helix transcriptional regulator [Acidimicrobiales bacterium]
MTSLGREGDVLSDDQFSAAVSAVTSAFGDPTRRRIYLYVRERPDGAGRPSKRYRPSAGSAPLAPPQRGNDLLITLLGQALALLPADEAEAMAEQVGEDYGRRLAADMSSGEGQRSSRVALHAIADALTAHGFEAHAEARGGSLALIKESCPFFDTARQHPVICAVDRGMVRGMLAGLSGATVRDGGGSRARGDAACVTFV